MDYPDKSPETEKQSIANSFVTSFSTEMKREVVGALISIIGKATVRSYVDRIRSALSALPQEVRFILRSDSEPVVFSSLSKATEFLKTPAFSSNNSTNSYVYQVVFGDGTEYERDVSSLKELAELHDQITILAAHMNALNARD